MAPSKYINHYGPLSDFHYYNLTTSFIECTSPSATRGRAQQLYGFEPLWHFTVPGLRVWFSVYFTCRCVHVCI